MPRFILLGLAAAFVGFIAFVSTPVPASAWELRGCTDRSVLHRISNRFRYQVRHVPHLPDVKIEHFSDVHQHRYLPAHDHRPIARRYCHASVLLSDGRTRRIWYVIESKMGFASLGSGVEFCVSGFDRWMVYNGSCRILR